MVKKKVIVKKGPKKQAEKKPEKTVEIMPEIIKKRKQSDQGVQAPFQK